MEKYKQMQTQVDLCFAGLQKTTELKTSGMMDMTCMVDERKMIKSTAWFLLIISTSFNIPNELLKEDTYLHRLISYIILKHIQI